MFKRAKLVFLIILLNVTYGTGHCIKIESYDPAEESSAKTPSRAIVPATPITCLDVSFFCFPSHAVPDRIRAIVLLCSNRQTLETEGWRQGQWLSFINGKTRKDEQLKIKASDCPVTITLQLLPTTESNGMAKKRKRTDTVSTVINLSKGDLFYEDNCPKGIELKLYTSSLTFDFVSLGILRKGEDFAPSPWDLWPIRFNSCT